MNVQPTIVLICISATLSRQNLIKSVMRFHFILCLFKIEKFKKMSYSQLYFSFALVLDLVSYFAISI